MKKIMIMAVALVLAPAMVTAQAKKKTAAQQAAEKKAAMEKAAADKRAAAEKAARDKEAALKKQGEDMENSAMAAADKALSSVSLMAWGGYNLTIQNDIQKNDTSSTFGGPSGGIHGYYGNGLQIGLSAGYLTYATTPENKASNIAASTVSIIPVEVRARYVIANMFFVGAFSGYGQYLATPENAAGKPRFVTTGLYAGFNYAVSPELSVALFCDARYLISLDTDLNNSVAKGNVLITPAIGVSFKF